MLVRDSALCRFRTGKWWLTWRPRSPNVSVFSTVRRNMPSGVRSRKSILTELLDNNFVVGAVARKVGRDRVKLMPLVGRRGKKVEVGTRDLKSRRGILFAAKTKFADGVVL